jgi:hypothetical protein
MAVTKLIEEVKNEKKQQPADDFFITRRYRVFKLVIVILSSYLTTLFILRSTSTSKASTSSLAFMDLLANHFVFGALFLTGGYVSLLEIGVSLH